MRDKDSNLIWESLQEGCGCALPVLRQDPKEKLKDLKRRVEAEEQLGDDKTITVSIEKESTEDNDDWKVESITNLIKWFEEYPQMLEVAKESNDALKQIAQNAIVDHYEVEIDDAVELIENAVNKLSEGDIDWSDEEKEEMFDKATKNETFDKLQRLKSGIVEEQPVLRPRNVGGVQPPPSSQLPTRSPSAPGLDTDATWKHYDDLRKQRAAQARGRKHMRTTLRSGRAVPPVTPEIHDVRDMDPHERKRNEEIWAANAARKAERARQQKELDELRWDKGAWRWINKKLRRR